MSFLASTSKSPVYLLCSNILVDCTVPCTVVFSGYLKTVFQTSLILYLLFYLFLSNREKSVQKAFMIDFYFFNNSSSEHMIYRHWNCISKSDFMDLRILAEGYFHRWCLYWLGLNYCFHSFTITSLFLSYYLNPIGNGKTLKQIKSFTLKENAEGSFYSPENTYEWLC